MRISSLLAALLLAVGSGLGCSANADDGDDVADEAELRAAQAASHGLPIEVEVETLDELDQALGAGATRILLDNFTTYDIRVAMERIAGRAVVELSGGVTLERVPELATTGAQFVSVGALTHSAPAADISFEVEPV